MPIRFRCRHCRQFLGISRTKAGTITDCPTCGKSIRVPNLDGSIDPIPSPELNLKDEQLVEALGELAQLGSVRDSKERAEVTSVGRLTERHSPQVSMPKAEAVRVPEAEPAQPVSPLPPRVPKTVAPAAPKVDADQKAETDFDAEEALRALAEAPPPSTVATIRSRRSRTENTWLIGGSIATAAVILAAALWVSDGRESPAPSSDAASKDGVAEQREEVPLPGPLDRADVPPGDATTLTGRITYISATGDSRPDAGARVLLLPNVKPGRVKLDVAGFETGADEIDTRVARAALRALGGDLAETDEDGRYRLNLPKPGDYHVLAISRHSSHETAAAVDPRLHTVLAAYFFRPASLLGQLAFQWDDFHFAGVTPAPRNFTFAAE